MYDFNDQLCLNIITPITTQYQAEKHVLPLIGTYLFMGCSDKK